MLRIPTIGIASSEKKHNCKLNIIADWIEGSLFFDKDYSVSKNEVLDVLMEEGLYSDQGFASEFVENCWNEIERRHKAMGSNQIVCVKSKRIEKLSNWDQCSPYSFCLAISIKTYYSIKYPSLKNLYNVQGSLFESICASSLKLLFPEWDFIQTGWSSEKTSKIKDILEEIGNKLNVSIRTNAAKHYSAHQKDAKLDILMYKKFYDDFCNIPIILMQCASGENWVKKTEEPNIERWKELVEFYSYPGKGLIIPFALSKEEFEYNSTSLKGTLIDRMRLISVFQTTTDLMAASSAKKINDFTKKIFQQFPKI